MTATHDDRRRERLMDQIRDLGAGGDGLIDRRSGRTPIVPRPLHEVDADLEPIYAALVAELGVPGQDEGLATQAIDMTVLLDEQVA